jgi:hypothetical protein
MKNLAIKSKEILFTVSNLEKKHKIITYASLLFLTISTYFLRTENQDIKINYATLEERNVNLKQNMIIFNRNYEGFPLPVWQKVKRGNEFILQYINPSYLTFLEKGRTTNAYDLIGKNNFELFPKKMAQMYYENDVAVAVTGKKLETIDEFIDTDGNTIELKVIKWRSIKDNKDTLIYGMVKEMVQKKIKL